eukprot:GDKJ01025602.1.p1 GENE.GDKJ01025602.1~~GDKJ01025602.1.p1  ORF type:complete len:589 (-),score=104.26 GDKJ01025602.1:70-1836(-)
MKDAKHSKMLVDGIYSTAGKSTEAKLMSLRRTLGRGVDPAFDYSVFDNVQKVTKKSSENQDEIYLPGPWGELQRLLKYEHQSIDPASSNARVLQLPKAESMQKSKSLSNLQVKGSSSFTSRGRNDQHSIFYNTTDGAPVGTYNIRWNFVSDKVPVHYFPRSEKTVSESSQKNLSRTESKKVLNVSPSDNNLEHPSDIEGADKKVKSDNDGYHSRPRKMSNSTKETLENPNITLITPFRTGIERVKSVPSFEKSQSSHLDALMCDDAYRTVATLTKTAHDNADFDQIAKAKQKFTFKRSSSTDFIHKVGRKDETKQTLCATAAYDPDWRAVRPREGVSVPDMTLQQKRPDPGDWFIKKAVGCVALEKLGVAGDYWEREQMKRTVSVPDFDRMKSRYDDPAQKEKSYSDPADGQRKILLEKRDKAIDYDAIDKSIRPRGKSYCLVNMKRQIDRATVNRVHGGNPLEANPDSIVSNLYHPNDSGIVDMSWRCHVPNFSTMKPRQCAIDTEQEMLSKCGDDWSNMPYENRTTTAAVKSARQRTDAIKPFKRERKIGSSPAPISQIDKSHSLLVELRRGRDQAGFSSQTIVTQ